MKIRTRLAYLGVLVASGVAGFVMYVVADVLLGQYPERAMSQRLSKAIIPTAICLVLFAVFVRLPPRRSR